MFVNNNNIEKKMFIGSDFIGGTKDSYYNLCHASKNELEKIKRKRILKKARSIRKSVAASKVLFVFSGISTKTISGKNYKILHGKEKIMYFNEIMTSDLNNDFKIKSLIEFDLFGIKTDSKLIKILVENYKVNIRYKKRMKKRLKMMF